MIQRDRERERERERPGERDAVHLFECEREIDREGDVQTNVQHVQYNTTTI